MRASRGEIKIEEILQQAELDFKEEYVFPDLKSSSGRPLRFDFVIFDDDGNIDFLIEFQGKQHYESIDWFGGNEKFEYQQEHDKRKREYAYKNNYNFLEIPYWDFDNIEDILKNIIYQESSNDGSFIM